MSGPEEGFGQGRSPSPGPDPSSADMERNARLYPWYAGVLGFWFWIPVFFLFFSAHLSLDKILVLEAIYYASVVLLELPSGYFSDRVGRRATLLISALAFIGSYGLFVTGDGFATFALAQFLLAAGYAFNSGTDTAMHFDSLAAAGRAEEYGDREARVARISFLAAAVGAVAGGAAGAFDLRLAYGLSLISSIVLLGIVWAMREPREAGGLSTPSGTSKASEASDPSATTGGKVGHAAIGGAVEEVPHFLAQLRVCLRLMRRPELAWLFGFALWMTVLIHIPYEFYQPYLDLLSTEAADPDMASVPLGSGPGSGGVQVSDAFSQLPVPLASGLVVALSMLIGSWFAGRSIRVRNRLGTSRTLLLGMAFIVLVTTAMGRFLAPWVVVLILLRNIGRALMAAPLNAAVTPRIPEAQRATYLSIQSLAGRLSFSLVLLILSAAAGAGSHPGWPELSRLLSLGALLGAAAWLALALSSAWVDLDAPVAAKAPNDASTEGAA